MCMFLCSFVTAAQESLGTFKQGEDVLLVQLCGTCTYNNITSITAPNSSIIISNVNMTKDGTQYSYLVEGENFTEVGTYNVNGFGDLDGVATSWAYNFEITPTGIKTPEGVPNVYAIIIFVVFGIACFFLFLSSQLLEIGPKVFCLLSALIFVAGSLLLGINFIQTYNIAEGISNSLTYIFFAIGLIIFVFFAYFMIRQSVAAFDAFQVKKGLKMDDSFGMRRY